MQRMENFLGHHPYIGALISVGHLAVGIILGATPLELPPIVMQLFQIGAWSAGIAAGIFTCYGVWKTHHRKVKSK